MVSIWGLSSLCRGHLGGILALIGAILGLSSAVFCRTGLDLLMWASRSPTTAKMLIFHQFLLILLLVQLPLCGASEAILGSSWGHLVHLGAILCHLGVSWAILEPSFGHFGFISGSAGVILGSCWKLSSPFRGELGGILALVGVILWSSWAVLSHSGLDLLTLASRNRSTAKMLIFHQFWRVLLLTWSPWWGASEAILGSTWGHLGDLGVILWRSWAILRHRGVSWAILGLS